MGSQKHLIIGCGPAALAAVQSIRSITREDEITMVTKEECLPYSPAALPYLLSHELKESIFFMKGEDHLKSMDVQLVRGKEVIELIPDSAQVKYRDGRTEGYDRLLIATGARPRVPEFEGLKNVPFHTFTTSQDFKKIEPLLGKKREVTIYGAGQISVELAEKLTLGGHDVTIVVRSVLLRRYFGEHILNILKTRMEQQGVRVLTQSTITSGEQSKEKIILTVNGKQKLTADLFIMATGVVPNTAAFPSIPVIDGGLKAGRHMETKIPNVYAAGDVSASPCFFDGHYGINPILPEAIEQGKVAGQNMAGEKMEYRGWIPTNWLRCFDYYAFNMGLTGPGIEKTAQILEKGNGESFRRIVLRDNCLIGVECLNTEPLHPGVLGYLITHRLPLNGYKDLLLEKPMETSALLMTRHRQVESGILKRI